MVQRTDQLTTTRRPISLTFGRFLLFLLAGAVLISCTVEEVGNWGTAQTPVIDLGDAPAGDLPSIVDGTWMYDQPYDSWVSSLDAFAQIGGDTLLRWGYRLIAKTTTDMQSQLSDMGCPQESGQSCTEKAVSDMKAAGLTKRSFLVYGPSYVAGQEHKWRHFSNSIMCGALDKKIIAGDITIYRILLPTGTNQNGCAQTSGIWDVLFVWHNSTVSDMEDTMLDLAATHGIEVFLGSPKVQVGNSEPGNNPLLIAGTRQWSKKVFADYYTRYSSKLSFAGIYQSRETAIAGMYRSGHSLKEVAPSTNQSDGFVYKEFLEHVGAFKAVFPNKMVVVSPYVQLNDDYNHSIGGLSYVSNVAGAVQGFRNLADTGVDVIAPQDGRGVGKSALYWPYEADNVINTIDPALALFDPSPPSGTGPSVDGTQTFEDEFNGSTKELFDGLKSAAAQEGVKLWANVEAMEDPEDNKNSYQCTGIRPDRSQTTKSRLDRAITMAGSQGEKVVVFEWSPFFLCDEEGESLLEEIWTDYDRPIVTQMFFWPYLGQNGLVLQGHNLNSAGGKIHLSWWEPKAGGGWTAKTGFFAPQVPTSRPNGQERVWIPFDKSVLVPNWWIHARGYLSDLTTGSHASYSLHY